MAKLNVDNPELVVREACWLAWQACGSPFGMGTLQNKPDATKEDVWRNIHTGPHGGDYTLEGPVNEKMVVVGGTEPGRVSADYVFGRMMKLRLEWDKDGVKFDDYPPRADYQSWCGKYPTYQDLIEASVKSLKGEIPF